jgi:hypothetical protein
VRHKSCPIPPIELLVGVGPLAPAVRNIRDIQLGVEKLTGS